MTVVSTPKPASAWRVYRNGKDTGIVETNLEFAVGYWTARELATKDKFKLVPEQ